VARDAKHGVEEFVNVVDELSVGGVDEFHGAVAAASQEAIAVESKRRAEP